MLHAVIVLMDIQRASPEDHITLRITPTMKTTQVFDRVGNASIDELYQK